MGAKVHLCKPFGDKASPAAIGDAADGVSP
jgi:hypothetical protein